MLKAAQKLASSFVPVPSAVEGFVGAVGNTSLIRLKTLSDQTGCNVYGKAEFTNPGGSVKDRAAIGLIQAFEKNGQLKPGGTVVEGTAGNTGIGLAHVCRAKGYKCVIYMPDTQSPAKVSLLKLLGADVRPVPAVAYDNPQNYNHQASRFADEAPNAVWTNQFDNLNNRQIHIETTGPEIWAQTQGTIDAFTCSAGTGGSLAGITHYLKDISDGKVKSYLADPPGSCLYSYVTSGGKSLERSGGSITEGIGQGRITDNFGADWKNLDGAFQIPDADTIRMVYSLLDKEGLYLGASSCLNVVGALRVAQHLGPGHTVVTLLCDGADRYASRLFSKKWLEQKKLYQELPEDLLKYAALE